MTSTSALSDQRLCDKPRRRSRAWRLTLMTATAVATTLIPNNAQAVLNIYLFDGDSGTLTIESRGTLQLGAPSGSAGCNPASSSLAFIISSANSISFCSLTDPPSYEISLISGQEPWGSASEFDGSYTGVAGFILLGPTLFATPAASGDPINSTALLNVPMSALGLTFTSGLIAQYKINSTNDTINIYADSPPIPPPASVPAPLPLFGAAAAFGWSRRLRRRISLKRHT